MKWSDAFKIARTRLLAPHKVLQEQFLTMRHSMTQRNTSEPTTSQFEEMQSNHPFQQLYVKEMESVTL
jgi:hypothetical protein